MSAKNSSFYLSENAFKQLKQELDLLVKKKRKDISERLEAAISLGDLSENAEFKEAKEEQLNNETRIIELEDIINRAVIVSQDKKTFPLIELGCTVKLQKDGSEEFCEYQVVGSTESDILNRKISNESPLGTSLLGKKKGETVEVVTPCGKIRYAIINIS
ncbi:MAG: transcription elongation factor GreA [bacterium]|nr:transcription elongation factor GreA [bacterium]